MIGNLNHIAIAVADLDAAIHQYQTTFGVFVSTPRDLPDHGVRVAIVKLLNVTIELITPLGNNSPIEGFLNKNPSGGLHHLCYEVTDIEKAKKTLASDGIEPIGDGVPKPGFHENPVLFFQPKDCLGVLIELEEIATAASKERIELSRIGPAHKTSKSDPRSLKGVDGIGIGFDIMTERHKTPKNNKEGE